MVRRLQDWSSAVEGCGGMKQFAFMATDNQNTRRDHSKRATIQRNVFQDTSPLTEPSLLIAH